MSGTPEIGSGPSASSTQYTVKPDDAHRARMTVAHHATDPEDCTELLQMLGLIPTPGVDS